MVPWPSNLTFSLILWIKPGRDQSLGIDDAAGLESTQIPEVDQGEFLFEDVIEAPFGESTLHGHLTALEAGADASAGPGTLSLMTAPGCFFPSRILRRVLFFWGLFLAPLGGL